MLRAFVTRNMHLYHHINTMIMLYRPTYLNVYPIVLYFCLGLKSSSVYIFEECLVEVDKGNDGYGTICTRSTRRKAADINPWKIFRRMAVGG